mmetsp:Transcript_6996/g.19894  ORF Transcript_6996/g.19894 Transcript_6996/m.19894 type:complete len:293 (+) Transcript_6996:213-1091(+)
MISNNDHIKVLIPPMAPRTITLSSAKISNLKTRKMRKTRKSRKIRNNEIKDVLSSAFVARLPIARPVSRNAVSTKVASKMFVTRSLPVQNSRSPWRYSFMSISKRKTSAKRASMKIQPIQSGMKSALIPKMTVFVTIAIPMNVSKPMASRPLKLSMSTVARSPATHEALPCTTWRIMSNVGHGRSGSSEPSVVTKKSLLRLRSITLKPLCDLGGKLIEATPQLTEAPPQLIEATPPGEGGIEHVVMAVESEGSRASKSSPPTPAKTGGGIAGCGTARGPHLATSPNFFMRLK